MLIKSKFCGYSRDGIRLYCKGGGGGSDAAEKMERERQARVEAATNTINSIFNNQANDRNALYDDQRNTVYQLNEMEAKRQAEEAARANRFGLARTGLLGGSVDVDSNSEINRRTNEGLMRAGSIADQAAADLKLQDEQSRANLISLAQSGIDTGTAASMALNGLSANAANAAGARGGASLGSLFDGLGNAYMYNQAKQGANAGYAGQYGNQFLGVSSPNKQYSGSTN